LEESTWDLRTERQKETERNRERVRQIMRADVSVTISWACHAVRLSLWRHYDVCLLFYCIFHSFHVNSSRDPKLISTSRGPSLTLASNSSFKVFIRRCFFLSSVSPIISSLQTTHVIKDSNANLEWHAYFGFLCDENRLYLQNNLSLSAINQ